MTGLMPIIRSHTLWCDESLVNNGVHTVLIITATAKNSGMLHVFFFLNTLMRLNCVTF